MNRSTAKRMRSSPLARRRWMGQRRPGGHAGRRLQLAGRGLVGGLVEGMVVAAWGWHLALHERAP
jgi:hypothetical protein